jgi:hypothetical protein
MATKMKVANMSKETHWSGLLIIVVSRGYFSAIHIPNNNGKSKMAIMLRNNDQKSTENVFTSVDRWGRREDQKKKFKGVKTKANNDEKAVSETDSATFPFAQ